MDQPIIQPQKLKKKLYRKWWFWSVIILIIILIISVLLLIFLNNSKNSYHSVRGAVDMTVVHKLKPSSEGLRLYSWNTPQGRIYAMQCSGPPYDISHSSGGNDVRCMSACMDGGTTFYDYQGNIITNCGAWGGGGDPQVCKQFNELKEKDADYRDPDCVK